MTSAPELQEGLRAGSIPPVEGSRDYSIDYLRTTLTLMVLAHHSSLAYTTWGHFDREHIFHSTAPIVDTARWVFFDYAENFNDVFFMALMFFVSGLFVYPALQKHGAIRFIRDRFLRLGVPFAFAVTVLIPIAYYASWQLSAHYAGFWEFYERLAMSRFTVGPPWFIWVLLLFDLVLALIVGPFKLDHPLAERVMRSLKTDALSATSAALVLSALVYLPLLFKYGFGTWANLYTSPFSFQISRIGLYALWFLFGFLVGGAGINNGLLSREGRLARNWPLWFGACVVAYNALWFIPKWSVLHNLSPLTKGTVEASLWVASCVMSSLGFLALFRGVTLRPRSWMISLNRSAYAMYLVHYVYITWMQRLLLYRPIPAAMKFLLVFLVATLLSWLTAQCLLQIPTLDRVL
ncbi:peptidoglycan/LPS O-acetylase OafA/YrhL [Granulicella aggregans]|uniref:Peptidoglycan/LPS O-acetylase OafA/YrhL n=1 Tax=Granulicella aggregans TaxID=474949 RepID=A0A7W8E5I6_9BACT|nr:acyltransferase [Granulicella aggregans]MBB5060153.1 peptidoglycan/LPS O-acetylase OafA/YrhL [Granulicella aggregans]